jgi:hypothetical protein
MSGASSEPPHLAFAGESEVGELEPAPWVTAALQGMTARPARNAVGECESLSMRERLWASRP